MPGRVKRTGEGTPLDGPAALKRGQDSEAAQGFFLAQRSGEAIRSSSLGWLFG